MAHAHFVRTRCLRARAGPGVTATDVVTKRVKTGVTVTIGLIQDDTGAEVKFGGLGQPTIVVTAGDTCEDGVQDGTETGVDCGGSDGCPRCKSGGHCKKDSDCDDSSGHVCVPAGGDASVCGVDSELPASNGKDGDLIVSNSGKTLLTPTALIKGISGLT